MDIKEIIDIIRDEYKDLLVDVNDGHEFEHVVRVMNYALQIQKHEGGNVNVLVAAALLHDVHRWLQIKENKFVSPRDSLSLIDKTLARFDFLSPEDIRLIRIIIERHEDYECDDGSQPMDIKELAIIQDADRLDAIGAIGLIRTIKYGAIYGIKDYVGSAPLYRDKKYNGEVNDISTVHHIYNKLLRLDEMLHTQTAKELAIPRMCVMQTFIDAFLDEWGFACNEE